MMTILQNAVIYVVPFLGIITLIVTIHELGHFLTARAFGIAVDRFSIGFGPRLWSWRDRWGVEWQISWLPLGGYVRFAGDENAASVPDQDDLVALRADIIEREGAGAEKRYFHFKPLWQRALVVVAGPVANFILSIALLSIFFGAFGEWKTPTRITKIEAGSAAAGAGLQVGDTIQKVDGRPLTSFESMAFYFQYRAGVPVTLTVEHGGVVRDMQVVLGHHQVDAITRGKATAGFLGVGMQNQPTHLRYNPIQAVARGAERTEELFETTAFMFGRLITGHVDPRQLSGVIGMGDATGAITKQAAVQAHTDHVNLGVELVFMYLQWAAMLSVSIGFLNLLPIPVLDGGHLLFYAYESVARRPLGVRVQAASYRVALALVVGLMLFAGWNDLQRLQVFRVFGGLFS